MSSTGNVCLIPWKARLMKTQPGYAPVVMAQDNEAVAWRHPEISQRRWDQVAPMIAAAPEMLESLSKLLRCVQLYGDTRHAMLVECMERAQVAINKAIGEATT